MTRLLLLLVAIHVAACSADDADDPLVVFAAASTVEAVSEAARRYEAAGHGRVVCSFAASSMLARQIEQGADADVFLSADERWMDEVARNNKLAPGSRVDLLENTLVWIAPRGRGFALQIARGAEHATVTGRIAVAEYEAPAGRYARVALNALGWWETLEPRLVPAADVRAALRMVETGATESGIVYATDAAASDRVEVVAKLPDLGLPRVRYPVAAVAGGHPDASRFIEWLRGPESAAIFRDAGFTTP